MKKGLSFFLSQLLLTLFVGIVLLTLYVGAGRQYMPYVNKFKPELSQWLKAQIKQPVAIDELIGSWSDFSPVIAIKNLEIGHRDNPIRIGYLKAKLDISASVFHRRPIFRHLIVSQVDASIKELGKQRWQLSKDWTLDFSQSEPTENDFLALLLKQKSIKLYNWSIQNSRLNGQVENCKLSDLSLRNQGSRHSLSGKAKWGYDTLFPVQFKANIVGSLWPYEAPDGRFYLQVAKHDWSRWAPSIKSPNIIIDKLDASANIWFRLEQGQLKSHYGIIDVDEVKLNTSGKPVNIPKGKVTVAGLGDDKGWYSVLDSEFLSAEKWPKIHFHYSSMLDAHGFRVEVEKLDVSRLTGLISTHKLLPTKIQTYLEGINPQGEAHNFGLSYFYPEDENLKPDAVISMDITEASSQAHRGIPGFRNISGKIIIRPESGIFRVNDKLASIHIDEAYEHFLDIKNPDGEFLWEIKEDSVDLILKQFSGLVQESPAQADMYLRIPLDDDPLHLGLMVGVKSGPSSLHKLTVPQVFVDEATRNWLDEAILGGKVNDFKLLINGDIGPKTSMDERSLEITFNAENGRLAYQKGWPEITDIKAKVHILDTGIKGQIEQAKSAGMSLVETAFLSITPDKKETMRLRLAAKTQGNLDESFALLTDTPLKDSIDDQLKDWYMQGEHLSSLQLGLSLGSQDLKPAFKLQSHLSDASIYAKPVDLKINRISGDIKFSLKEGLHAKELQAKVLGGNSAFSIKTINKKSGFNLAINSAGTARWRNIHRWYPSFLSPVVSGYADYKLNLNIDSSKAQRHQLNLTSALLDTDIQIPKPYGKAKSAQKQVSVQWRNHKKNAWLDVNYAGNVSAALQLKNNNFSKGIVRLDEKKAKQPQYPGVFVYGDIQQPIVVEDWYQVWSKISDKKPKSKSRSNKSSSPIVREFKFNIAKLEALGADFGSSFISGTSSNLGWEIDVANRIAKGQIAISHTPKPISVQLDYLHIKDTSSNTDNSENTKDRLAEVNPKNLPDMDIWLAELYYKTRNLGSWQIKSRAQKSGYAVNVEQAKIKNLDLSTTLLWTKEKNKHHSYLQNIKLKAADLADTQRDFRVTPVLESKSFNLNGNANWQGSPANFKLKNLKALINYKIEDGRIEVKEAESLRGFGALNLGAINRRLRLDFSDLYESGLSFDEIKAELKISDGILNIQKPIIIEGPSGKYVLSGSSDLMAEALDMEMVVTLPVTSSLPLVVVLAGLSPPVAGAVYVTERLIGNELERFTSAKYSIDGSWDEPELELVNVFADKAEGEETPGFKERIKRIFFLD